MVEIILGTSGWYYKEWVGPFYEGKSKKFPFYASYFGTVEINSTFYRYPTSGMVYGWYKSSPKDFKFSAKLPRLITHQKKLGFDTKIENDLLRFLELLNPLKASNKLGVILIQLPPSFTFDTGYENLARFLEILPEEYRFAVEFRDWSWLRSKTWNLLKKNKIAYTIVDEPLLPPDVHLTADFAYFRWHGRGNTLWYNYHYSEKELEPWIPKVKEVANKVKEVYGYFNNHFHGYAVENCVQVLEMLGKASHKQTKIKNKIIKHNLVKRPNAYQKKLSFFENVSSMSLDDLLLASIDKEKLYRAKRIKDNELEIIEISEKSFKAKIRKYTINIDINKRIIKHNCRDWIRGLAKKKLCKHVGKMFLILPSEYSIKILRDFIRNRNQWRFEIPIQEIHFDKN